MKKISLMVMLLGMSVNLVACGSKGGGDVVTITHSIWVEEQREGLRTMADEFESANPDIKIEIELVGWGDYWTMLEAAATGGSLPDVFWMHSNEFFRYASNGMLYNLTDLVEASDRVRMDKFPEELVSLYNFEGAQYAIPKDFDTIGLWYNKTMFDEAGLDYPDETWTWDDLFAAAEALTKEDGSQYGILMPLHSQEGYTNFIYQNGGFVINEDKTRSGWDDSRTIEALKFYISFIEKGVSPAIFDHSETAQGIQNGLAAMALFGSWNLGSFMMNDYMVENLDVAVLPSSHDGGRASIFNGLGSAIAHDTKHPEEAWRWVEYLSSEEGQMRQSELGMAISALEGTADAWVNCIDDFNLQVFLDMLDYAVIRPYSKKTVEWENKTDEFLRDAFSGEKAVEEVAEAVTEMMNEILETEQ